VTPGDFQEENELKGNATLIFLLLLCFGQREHVFVKSNTKGVLTLTADNLADRLVGYKRNRKKLCFFVIIHN
jgi:hypothetical protein